MEKVINLEKEKFIEYLHVKKGYTIEEAKEIANIYY